MSRITSGSEKWCGIDETSTISNEPSAKGRRSASATTRGGGAVHVPQPMVERNNRGARKTAGDQPAHFSGSGACIKGGEPLSPRNQASNQPQQDTVPAKPTVDPRQISQAPCCRVAGVVVQPFPGNYALQFFGSLPLILFTRFHTLKRL